MNAASIRTLLQMDISQTLVANLLDCSSRRKMALIDQSHTATKYGASLRRLLRKRFESGEKGLAS
jgi:hypothetical protein